MTGINSDTDAATADAQQAASPSARPTVGLDTQPALGRGFRFQWEPAQQAHVLLYPEGMVKLNGSAGEILKRCNGVRTVGEIVKDLEAAFATTGLAQDVTAFMTAALEKKWLEIRR
jgi:pyrroloquinoline quinone biosynthesis protein D